MKKTAGRTEPISQEMDGGGWIKLHRKALDSDIFADPDLWRLFTWCLLSAGHTGRHVPAKTGRGNTLIRLGPGQFVYGRKTAARDLHWPESTLNDRMKRLEATEAISIKPDTHFSIVTVVNWGIYQGSGGERRHPSDTQATGNQHPSSRQPTGNRHPSNTNKNVEKGKKGKKAQKGEKARDDDDDDVLVSWGKARERARELEQAGTFKVHGEQQKATQSDRLDILRACKLTEAGVIQPAWLEEAAQRTRDNKPGENAYGYFLKTLRGICAHQEPPVDFDWAKAAFQVPEPFRGSRKERREEHG